MRFDFFPTSWQLAARLFRAASFAIFLAAFALALPGCGTGSGDDAVADGGQALPENLAASAGATDQDDVTAEMGTAPQQIVEGADGTRWAAGRILVQPRAGLSDEEMEKIANRHAGRGLGKIQQINVHVIEVPPQAEEAVAKALANNKHVAFAERDMVVKPEATPNDPSYGSQWHLPKIGAPSAWDLSRGDDVVVAILDTGVDGSHPDLVAKLVPGWNVYENNANTADVHGHGTWVAGIAAGTANNGLGVAGVAWDSWLMPMRISAPDGSASFSSMASALTWAADHGAHIANISYQSVSSSSTVQSAARYLRSKGGLTVVAAGNTGVEQAFAASPDLLSVSATTSSDAWASFSSFGQYVDLSAPGAAILTTSRGGGYATVQGTSFSSPCVAGALALMMSANPALGPDQVERLLLQTTDDLGTSGWDKYFGQGRLNAAAAVAAAQQAQAQDTQPPTAAIAAPTGGTVRGLVAVDVTASDNVGVAWVELLVNGVVGAVDDSQPYGFSWDSSKTGDGTVSLVAQAFDGAGNKSSSRTVTVTVDNVADPVDTTAPSVFVLSPAAGSNVSGNVTLRASAEDDVGVASIQVWVDGKLKCSGDTSPLSCAWNTRKETLGSHSVEARAADRAGNTAVSAAVTVNVAKAGK